MKVHNFLKVYDKVDAFITPSEFLKKKLVANGFPAEKIYCIPTFTTSKSIVGEPHIGSYGLYFGRVTEEKGVEIAIKAYEKMPKKKLVIMGDDTTGEGIRLKKYVREKGLTNIEFLGFKEGVTREVWEKYYYEDNLPALENLCHKIPVQVGEAYYLGGGLPHALGTGCLVIEVQETSDITLGTRPWSKLPEKWRENLPEDFYNERLLGSYIYDGCSYEENLKRWRSDKKIIRSGEWGEERMLIGPEQTSYFSFSELNLNGKTELVRTGFPQVGIVTSGSGKLSWNSGISKMEIKKGMEIFFPYDIPGLAAEGQLSLVLCNPEGAL